MLKSCGQVDTNHNTCHEYNVNKSLGYSLSYIKVAKRIFNFIRWYPDAFPTRKTIANGEISIKTVSNAIARFKRDGLFLVNPYGIKRPNLYRIGPLIQSSEYREYIISILTDMNLYLKNTSTFHSGIAHNSNIQSQCPVTSLAFDCRVSKIDFNFWEEVLQRVVDAPRSREQMFDLRADAKIFSKKMEYSNPRGGMDEYVH